MARPASNDGAGRTAPTLLILSGIYVAAAVLVDPVGEFPANDDYNYAVTVKAIVERGEFHLPDALTSSVVAQHFWGALFCLPMGFSFTALRISTLVLGLAGVVATYLLLGHFRLGRGSQAMGTLLVAFNPLYFGQSCTFMTDVPFYALLALSVWLVVGGIDRGSMGRYWAGLGVALVSIFIRQLGLGVFIGVVLGYPLARRSFRGWMLNAVLPTAAAVGAWQGYEALLHAIDEYPGEFYSKHDTLKMVLVDLIELELGALKFPISRVLKSLVYCGLFLVPLLIPLVGAATRGWRPGRRWAAAAGSAAGAALAAVGLDAIGLRMPLLGNVIADFGMGIQNMPGGGFPNAPRALWVALTGVGIWGAGAWTVLASRGVVETARRWRDSDRAFNAWHLAFLFGLCGMLFVPAAMMYSVFLDRYLLPLLPFAILLVTVARDRPMPWEEASRGARVAAAGTLAVMMALSVASVHDYLGWNRARWDAASYAVDELGVDPGRIDAGFEFNNYVHFERYLGSDIFLTIVELDPETGMLPGATHVVALAPLEGRPVLATFECDPWMPYSPRRIFLLGDVASGTAGEWPPAVTGR